MVKGSGFRVQGSGFKVKRFKIGDQGKGCGVQMYSLQFGVRGLEFRV
jgi:hypothetical protein